MLAGLFMMPGTILEAADDSFWLCSIFYLAAIVVGFAGEYWRGQYLVVGCNPSVSKETKRRINVNRRKDWIPFYAAGFLTVLLLFVAAGYKPEWNFEKDSKQKTTVAETKEKEEPAAGPESQFRETVVRQQQKLPFCSSCCCRTTVQRDCGTAAAGRAKGQFLAYATAVYCIDCTDCGGSYFGCLWHF